MKDHAPGRGASAPKDGLSCAIPSSGVKIEEDSMLAQRARASPAVPRVCNAETVQTVADPCYREDLVSLAHQGAYVLLLDRDTGEALCEPTRDPTEIAQIWDANRRYRPRPAIASTKRNASVQPPEGFECWWPPKGWKPGVPVLDPALGVHPPVPPTHDLGAKTLRASTEKQSPVRKAALDATHPKAPRKQSPKWVSTHHSNGHPLPSFSNAIEFLKAEWGEQLWLNLMTGMVMLGRDPMTDGRIGRLRDLAERTYGLRFSAQTIGEAVTTLAEDQPRHPVREYLEGLQWDGTTRLESLADKLCRTPTDLDRVLVRCFVLQSVARVLDPGCKADCCFVLYGEQGTFKSSALQALAGEFFSNGDLPDNPRDQGQLLRTSWIHELGEIDRYLGGRNQSTVKAMLSRATDAYRPPYGRHPIRVERTYVLTGTTNQRRFLTDLTGNRRYWIVEAPATIDTAWIEAQRDQLWAEAVEAFHRGERWWLTKDQERISAERNAEYAEADALDALVAQAIEGQHETTVLDVCTAILTRGLTSEAAHDHAATRARTDKSLQTRIGAALTRLGWEQGPRRRVGPRNDNHFVRPWIPKGH